MLIVSDKNDIDVNAQKQTKNTPTNKETNKAKYEMQQVY